MYECVPVVSMYRVVQYLFSTTVTALQLRVSSIPIALCSLSPLGFCGCGAATSSRLAGLHRHAQECPVRCSKPKTAGVSVRHESSCLFRIHVAYFFELCCCAICLSLNSCPRLCLCTRPYSLVCVAARIFRAALYLAIGRIALYRALGFTAWYVFLRFHVV